jgi:hypothetical protein
LKAILEPHVTLAVWHRELPNGLAADLDALCARHDFDVDLRFVHAAADLSGLFSEHAPSPALDALRRDITRLVDLFRRTVGCRAGRLRLETVSSDACRLFHVDVSSLRLLVTYSGLGTQWIANDGVCRDEMGLRGRTVDQANAAIVPRAAAIRAVRRFSAALLKGEGYPGNLGNGIVHRSPPLGASGQRRLRLCLDAESEDCG